MDELIAAAIEIARGLEYLHAQVPANRPVLCSSYLLCCMSVNDECHPHCCPAGTLGA